MDWNPEESTAVYIVPADVRSRLAGIPLPKAIDLADGSALWETVLDDASRYIEDATHRNFAATDYTGELQSGRGREIQIVLEQRPVISVSRIDLRNRAGGTLRSLLPTDENTLYVLDKNSAIITLLPDTLTNYLLGGDMQLIMSGTVPKGYNNITVAYRAGYEPDRYPPRLKKATALSAAVEIMTRAGAILSGGVSSFSADGVSMTYGKPFQHLIEKMEKDRDDAIASLADVAVGGV